MSGELFNPEAFEQLPGQMSMEQTEGIAMNEQKITLDTPLSTIEWNDAQMIGDDLIDTRVAGDDWGMAWARVLRVGGTVRELRDDLYARSDETLDL